MFVAITSTNSSELKSSSAFKGWFKTSYFIRETDPKSIKIIDFLLKHLFSDFVTIQPLSFC